MALVLLAIPVIWNAGQVELSDVNENYVVRLRSTDPAGKPRMYEGYYAIKLKELIEKSAAPSRSSLNILYQQLWYNAITTGYDMEFWVEPAESRSAGTRYGLYLSGNTLFLRLEYDGRNRVLSVPFTKSDIEAILAPQPAEGAP